MKISRTKRPKADHVPEAFLVETMTLCGLTATKYILTVGTVNTSEKVSNLVTSYSDLPSTHRMGTERKALSPSRTLCTGMPVQAMAPNLGATAFFV